MAEEFVESEVVFPDHRAAHDWVVELAPPPRRERENCRRRAANSMPVSIPERTGRRHFGSAEEEAEEEEMTPPHEIVKRRVAAKMAFSVCTGNGRTLKGRDLSQVRNSILRFALLVRAMSKGVRSVPYSGAQCPFLQFKRGF
ncbi:hypothetical protein JHK85_042451 [Glycine max]|nr:hypothetical protein JHK85_042451 [Glycine max]